MTFLVILYNRPICLEGYLSLTRYSHGDFTAFEATPIWWDGIPYWKCVRASLQPDCSRKHLAVTVYNQRLNVVSK